MNQKDYDETENEHLDKLIHNEDYILVDKNYYNELQSKIQNLERIIYGKRG